VPTAVTGDPGVKMTGPYHYVAPSYWTIDKDPIGGTFTNGAREPLGGAWSFNTETSMGPAVPPVESLREMLPKEKLWPVNEAWEYHAGGGPFRSIGYYQDAVDNRYGKSDNVEDFARKSQAISYEGERAMFEAFSRNKYNSTGVVQWMLNNAWPSVIWHLYDFYLRPGGGYFGTKIACEPLHPVYGYDDNAVWLVSSQYTDASGLKVSARVLNLDMSEKFSKEVTVDATADSTQKLIDLPQIDDLSAAYFLVLTVTDASGKRVGSNFYWLSTKPEKMDWAKSTWYMTPTTDYADFTSLNTLPRVKLKVVSKTEHTITAHGVGDEERFVFGVEPGIETDQIPGRRFRPELFAFARQVVLHHRAGRRQNIQHVHATDQRRFHGLPRAFIHQIEVQPVESRADVFGAQRIFQTSVFRQPVPHDAAAIGRHHSLAGRIVMVQNRPARSRPLGRSKEYALGCRVLFHCPVKIQMIASQVSEHRGVKMNTVHARQRQGVRGHLHGELRAAALFELGRQPDHVQRLGRRVHGLAKLTRKAVLDGADHRGDAAGVPQDRVDQVGSGGLAVGAGDASEGHTLIRTRIEIPRGDGQRLAALLHFNPGCSETFRAWQLADHCTRAAGHRIVSELAPVHAGPWKRKKHKIFLHPAGIVLQPGDVPFRLIFQ
jgi:hypothetical protein